MSIQIKAFPLTEESVAEFNKFVKEHPPRSTEKQSGIVFQNNNVVIIYDDGHKNPNDEKALIKSLLEGERHKQFLVRHKIATSELALEKLKPAGYVKGISTTKLKELVKAHDETMSYDMVQSITQQIENIENSLLLDRHEDNRLQYEIEAYEAELNK